MSKHNHNNRQPQQVAAPAAAEEKAVDAPEVAAPAEPAVVPPQEAPAEAEAPQQPETPVPAAEQVAPPPPPEQPVEKKAEEGVKKFTKPTDNLTTSELMSGAAPETNLFARRRAMNAAATNHSMVGNKLIQLFDAYKARMSVPSKDKEENKVRIKMLQDILNTACPQNPLDLQTATDVARIMFDKLREGWGTIYTDSTIFRMGETLKGTAYDLDKLVMFIEAYVQMVEASVDKSPVMFDEGRLNKILKNPNMVIAMTRIKENINKRNGFSKA